LGSSFTGSSQEASQQPEPVAGDVGQQWRTHGDLLADIALNHNQAGNAEPPERQSLP
jgi:hypothetical protein